MSNDMSKLKELLSTMDVPINRINDVYWLSRNIHFRNSDNKNFKETKELITKIIKNKS